jgi:hypothetical protein
MPWSPRWAVRRLDMPAEVPDVDFLGPGGSGVQATGDGLRRPRRYVVVRHGASATMNREEALFR